MRSSARKSKASTAASGFKDFLNVQHQHDHEVQSQGASLREVDKDGYEQMHEQHQELRLCSAMLVGSFLVRDRGCCDLEASSAYGAAILMPQLARTAGWPSYLTGLTVRSYIFLFLNIGIQLALLHLIAREEEVMNVYAGQMYLCNFAQGNRGPHGTVTTPARTYPFEQWITRLFVKDSLKRLFPDKVDQIEAEVDPGEYALESYGARWVCCFIFVMATMHELLLIFNMCQLLWYVPTKPQPWLDLKEEEAEPGQEQSWLDMVEIRIQGIPLTWKLIYLVVVLLPKFIIWKTCIEVGIGFLMDTSTIEDLIVNSVAMAFILNIDEMICGTLMSESTRVMLAKCEDFPLYDVHAESSFSVSDILTKFGHDQKLSQMRFIDLVRLAPSKLIATLFTTGLAISTYYVRHCTFGADGHMISKTMFTPVSSDFSIMRTILPYFFAGETQKEPFWEMPNPN